MEVNDDKSLPENKPESLNMLRILCILTFIGGGMQFISNLIVAIFYNQIIVVVKAVSANLKLPGIELIIQARPLFFGVLAVFFAGSVIAAVYMWNLKKIGFHLYTTAQILIILSPMYYFHQQGPSFFDLILSGLFVFLYSRSLNMMK